MSGADARLRAQLAATEAEARTALDELHRRVEAAEAERDAMRERTERNEAALRVVALWLGGPRQSSQAADVEALARSKGQELDAALVCLAAERAYHDTTGRPWAERIAAKRRADEARAVLARMMGGES